MDGEVATRYGEREQVTQALAYAATLQDRGWACLLAGAAFVILRARDGGVFARLQRPRAIDLGMLAEIRERTGLSRLLVEPALRGHVIAADGERTKWHPGAAPFEALTWKRSTRGIAHSKTCVVDLSPGMPAVVASFSTVARRNVRKALRSEGVTYEAMPFDATVSADIAAVRALYQEFLAERPNLSDEWAFRSRLTAHFGTRGAYVLARGPTGLLGVIYLLLHDRVAYYYAAFSRTEARSARVPTGLVHAAMAYARACGCDLFDFVGVQDERTPKRNGSWAGFTEFKQRFGGVPVHFPLAYEAIE